MSSWWRGRGGENKEEGRITALERAVEGLESRQRMQKVEWESVLDKVNSVMGRLNARIRKAIVDSDVEDEPKGVPPPTVAAVGTHALLTDMRARKRGVLSG